MSGDWTKTAARVEVRLREDNWGTYWALVAIDGEGVEIETLGEDGGEPEDQLLVRDWSWVGERIQELLDEVELLRQQGRQS